MKVREIGRKSPSLIRKKRGREAGRVLNYHEESSWKVSLRSQFSGQNGNSLVVNRVFPLLSYQPLMPSSSPASHIDQAYRRTKKTTGKEKWQK
ncbi:unnamed protein product [Dovyalis caffra]|uniref:Uncharacterized protein n=1 Tax=Dovyalis caffra TaxID=77055 RepID=A0AAV1S0C4_9ROSI|nr:unnamed protein product [Dovyalis caffra]